MKWILIFICFFSSVQSSVFLHNDSSVRLTAVVIGANGKKMGEKSILPEGTGYVEDYIGQSDPVGKTQTPEGDSSYSLTPYTVFWYCDGGVLYSTCENIGSGALAAPNLGQGPMYCPKSPSKDNSSQSPSPY
ncbi:MAG: hypothetical protein EB051_01575 [Chlamydiia bacterium]|nr:hypothetical protein [Chlamydiia bacterium]